MSLSLQRFIEARLAGGLDASDVAAIADRAQGAKDPAESLRQVLVAYSDRFTSDGAAAFSRVAHRIGSPKLEAALEIHESTRATLAALRTAIGRTEAAIAVEEAANEAKAKEIAGLVERLKASVDQVDELMGLKAFAGIAGMILTGGAALPLLAGLVASQADANKGKALQAELERARESQAGVQARLASYGALKQVFTRQLEGLRASEKAAVDRMAEPAAVPTRTVPRHALVGLARAAETLDARRTLLANLTEQLALVEKLHEAAADVGGDLAAVAATLREKVRAAEAAVAESKDALVELVVAIVQERPGKIVARFAERQAYERVAAFLAERGIDLDGLRRRMPAAA